MSGFYSPDEREGTVVLGTERKQGMRHILYWLVFCFVASGVCGAEAASPEPTGRPVYTNEWGMAFVYIPPGTVMMGTSRPATELPDKPLHRGTIRKGFQIMTTEVTQGQWASIMGNNPSMFADCGKNCPVENIRYEEIKAFIKKLNRLDSGCVYRLPTEPEWEYACRAGTLTEFYWGDSPRCDRANYGFNTRIACDGCEGVETCLTVNPGNTTPVGSYPPNPWGLYDMIGNVFEVCVNPGLPDPERLMKRGGSYGLAGMMAGSGRRGRYYPSDPRPYIGFRLVRVDYPGYQEEPGLDFKVYKEMVKRQEKIMAGAKSAGREKKTLFDMVREDRTDQLARALSKNPGLLNRRDRFGNTPLIYAVQKGHVDMVRMLLLRGANPDIRGKLGDTALHAAACLTHTTIARILIAGGADLEIQNSPVNNMTMTGQGTPLHVAVRHGNLKLSRLLIRSGANIQAKNVDGDTPLHLAARRAEMHTFEGLLDLGADINAKNSDGRTPVQVALNAGYRSKLKQMFDNRGMAFPEPDIGVGELIMRINHIEGFQKEESVQKAIDLIERHPDLVTKSDSDGETPLHAAAFHEAEKIISLLIEKGADVNAKDRNGETPIHRVHDAASARQLIAAGADVNLPDSRGDPPLSRAASLNQIALARVLLKAGADPEATDSQGRTAIDIARTLRHEALLELLLEYKK